MYIFGLFSHPYNYYNHAGDVLFKKTLFDRDGPVAVVQLVVSKCIGVMLT